MYELEYTTDARRSLRKLPTKVSKVIVRKITKLADNPYAENNNIKALKGILGFRLRVGDYRVVYSITDSVKIIKIIKVGHRKEVYGWN